MGLRSGVKNKFELVIEKTKYRHRRRFTMENGNMAPNGMVVTPHHLGTQSGLAILREGGTAIEAAIAAAATLAVVYPHMNSIGGDGFWLIIPPHDEPLVIEACGAAGSLADFEFFKGLEKIPYRGPKSAITVPGTVGGWQEALNYLLECGYKTMPTSRLLDDAIKYAEEGFPISDSQVFNFKKMVKDGANKEFVDIFLPDGKVPKVGDNFKQKTLSQTLKLLAKYGLNSFYHGRVANMILEDIMTLNMPITESDLKNFKPVRKTPLRLNHSKGELFNTPPPTQGLVSLSILGMLDKLKIDGKNEGIFIHAAVEATKQAFHMRDQYITDPADMKIKPEYLLSDGEITKMAQNINFNDSCSIGKVKGSGDTIWLGVMDNKGFSVSFIQSVYHSWGSELVLPKTGILWHNRGTAFTLDEDKILSIKPGKKPFHTLNPAAARLKDGRMMLYGTRGADGQAQTQAAIFHRYAVQDVPLQKSVSMPRWLYGQMVGPNDYTLKLENRFCVETVKYLKERGHEVVLYGEFSEEMGHAGALVRHPNGTMEGAFDPRSNGSAAGF